MLGHSTISSTVSAIAKSSAEALSGSARHELGLRVYGARHATMASGLFDLLKDKNLVRRFKAGQLSLLLKAAQGITLYSSPGAATPFRFFWRGHHDTDWA